MTNSDYAIKPIGEWPPKQEPTLEQMRRWIEAAQNAGATVPCPCKERR